MTTDDEMNLRAWIGSVYFRGLFRGAVIVLTAVILPGLAYVAAVLTSVRSDQLGNAKDIAIVQDIQSDMSKASADFRIEVRNDIEDVQDTIERLEDTSIQTRQDVALIKGILMRKSDVAGRLNDLP